MRYSPLSLKPYIQLMIVNCKFTGEFYSKA